VPQQMLLGQYAIVSEGELHHHLAGERAEPDFRRGGVPDTR
jgi:hypothetical protein